MKTEKKKGERVQNAMHYFISVRLEKWAFVQAQERSGGRQTEVVRDLRFVHGMAEVGRWRSKRTFF